MSLKNYPLLSKNSKLLYNCNKCLLLFFIICFPCRAQVYQHNFGTTPISAHPYNGTPTIADSHFSNFSWSNGIGIWTSTAGASGQAIRVTGNTNTTITLSLNIAPSYQAEITGFNFWRQRSNLGPQIWTMAINGINVGGGTTQTAGAPIGNTVVANAVSGLTGTVTVTIFLSNYTGNGNFSLDDFTLIGNVTSTCNVATITSFSPATGPEHTLVTITGNGFQSGAGTTAVRFNGISAVFEVVSDTIIKAYVPSGTATGNISVVANGCEAFATVPFTELVSVSTGNFSSDIYISELHDATPGDGGVIELYNGTAATVNLSGYTIRRYGDIGGGTFYTVYLSGSIPPGGIFLVGIGTGAIPCSISENQHYNTGFNANDEFQLYKNGVLIDDVHTPGEVGYSIIREPDAVAPKTIFNNNDWSTSLNESCADIGSHDVITNTPPVPSIPASNAICEGNSAVFSAVLANPAGYMFQWKTLNASGNWVNITNVLPYSGANTNTLTVNLAPASFNGNQYYCQVTSAANTVVSHAAQLEVEPLVVPDFATSLALCEGETAPILHTTSPNGITGIWNPATISNTVNGNYIFTPNPGQCAANVTLAVTVDSLIIPDFSTTLTICSGDTVPILGMISPNGITGIWNPDSISNTAGGSYIFTPNLNQCATTVTLSVNVNSNVIPDFETALSYCTGETPLALAAVSPNGITGTWMPSVINNTISGAYVFTPNAGQCAGSVTLNVTINDLVLPGFPAAISLCNGGNVPNLDAVSPNGIVGIWNPATIDNSANGSYTFTPNPGQCAASATLDTFVNALNIPDFPTAHSLCNGETAPILNPISPNGISGSWNPAVISNTANGTYIFTPNPGQCASPVTVNVVVIATAIPDFATTLTLCNGQTAPSLAAISPNGIAGTWNPATISNTLGGTYTFTPNAGQCAEHAVLAVTVNSPVMPNFPTAMAICSSGNIPVLATASPNGISGTWNPATIDNTANGSYVFTPNPLQCANSTVLNVTITDAVIPDFATHLALCSEATMPVLNNVSPNGVSGIWLPATINNNASGTYVFTPNAGQCAQNLTLAVTIANAITPDFDITLALCEGETAPVLGSLSPNGITGTWNPPVVSNTLGGTYIFTPDAGQCARTLVLTAAVYPLPQPILEDAFVCIDNVTGQALDLASLDCGLPNAGYDFVWTWNGNPLPTTSNIHLATLPGIYKVVATNTVSGCSAQAQATVSASSMALASAVTGADFSDNPVITVHVTGGSGSYIFQLDGGLSQASNIFTGVSQGEHEITVIDTNGCEPLVLQVYILDYPHFFTPNNDGFFDYWNIAGLSGQQQSRIYIFDRYGKLLKTLKPSDDSGWDGTYNGNTLPSTDYWFTLSYQNAQGAEKEFKAHFSLKR